MNTKSKWVLIIGVLIVVSGITAIAVNANRPVKLTGSSTVGSGTTDNLGSSKDGSTPGSASSTKTPTPSCYTAAQAASEEGQTGCVQFTGYAYTSPRGEMYLDQYSSAPYGFSAYIPAGSSFGPSLLDEYSGQSIDVTGSIISYNGEPEIEVTSASQVTLAQ